MTSRGFDDQGEPIDISGSILGCVFDDADLGCVLDVEGEHGLGPDVLEDAGLEYFGCAVAELLGRLGDKKHRTRKLGPQLGEDMSDSQEHGRVHVMAAGVHQPDLPGVEHGFFF